jgi:uncharacterized membrane protein
MSAEVNNSGWKIGRLTLLLTLTVLAGFVLFFINSSVLPYAVYNANRYGDFWPRRHGLILHIACGIVSVLLGLLQLWLGATGQVGGLHRMAGKAYVVAVAIGSVAAIYLALTSTGPLGYRTGLLGLSLAWALTTAVGYIAARCGNGREHREWMVRSYVVTFAFVTFRFFTRLVLGLWPVVLHVEASQVEALMAWACWAVPLLLLEPFLHRIKPERQARNPL